VETEDPDSGRHGDTASGDENIVRLPRDWLGPRDELVPIALDPGAAGSPTAAEFWGERSAAVQEVELAGEPQPVSEAGGASSVRSSSRLLVSSIRRLRSRAPAAWAVAIGVLATAIVAFGLQVIGRSGERTSRPPIPGRAPLFSSLAPRFAAGAAVMQKIAAHRLSPADSRTRAARNAANPSAHVSHSSTRPLVVSQTYEPTVSTAPAVPKTTPAVPAATGSSADGQPTVSNLPAFGANGLLGPGHSPNG
jgi:hypothetical protein